MVSPGYLDDRAITVRQKLASSWRRQGKTVVYCPGGRQVQAAHRPGGHREAGIEGGHRALKKMGIRCMMLTGDSRGVAKCGLGGAGAGRFLRRGAARRKGRRRSKS